jgi:hypothetical protein
VTAGRSCSSWWKVDADEVRCTPYVTRSAQRVASSLARVVGQHIGRRDDRGKAILNGAARSMPVPNAARDCSVGVRRDDPALAGLDDHEALAVEDELERLA